uniref:PIR2-like helical domain-containing protein n=1 Tax=Oryza barthii TaxID=65489 RepID=A0A0D3HCU6_9ORYZ
MAEQPIIGHSPEANTLSPTSSPLPLPPITIHAPPFTRALHHAASSFPLLPPHRSHRRKGAAVARIGIEPAMGRRQQPAASGASPSSATASQKSLIPQIQYFDLSPKHAAVQWLANEFAPSAGARCELCRRWRRKRQIGAETTHPLQLSASPVDEKPELLPAVLDGGFCFGPLDPVSNIITNAIRHLTTGEDSGADVDEIEMRRGLKTKARGPSGFMTFRYLPTLEALNFLCAAEGDLLAAVHLVEAERCMSCAFDIGSCTARTALRCTAGAAGHRDPGRVASEMLSLFSKAYKIASHLLSRTADRLTCSAVEHLRHLLLEKKAMTKFILVLVPPRLPPELAAFSPLASLGVTVKDERTLERCTKSLQSVLVDKIHGFYLEALALLPQHLLRGRYHRSVVMAGHCYGPLDPASNIILNTIWYDAAFPVPKEQHLDLDMIGRWALIRAECCSIAGLVAGLAGDYNPSELQAIRCLLYANGDFATAMSVLQQALLNQELECCLTPSCAA